MKRWIQKWRRFDMCKKGMSERSALAKRFSRSHDKHHTVSAKVEVPDTSTVTVDARQAVDDFLKRFGLNSVEKWYVVRFFLFQTRFLPVNQQICIFCTLVGLYMIFLFKRHYRAEKNRLRVITMGNFLYRINAVKVRTIVSSSLGFLNEGYCQDDWPKMQI